ncbi:MAG: hypothetical protein V7664_13125 [Qipengyuania sp.]|uniref:hypothetical protein n=1 Tax=Qipengyuania sp. TaxID=2004515 RepID=UPI0030021BB8
MAHTFFPYPAKSGLQLTLTFEGAVPETVGRTHDFSHLSDKLPSFNVRAKVDFDDNLLSAVMDPSEHESPPYEVVLRLVSTASRKREAIPMVRAGGSYEASFGVDPAAFFEEIEVEALVLRSKSLAAQNSTYASDKGSIVIFSSGSHVIQLTEKPPANKNNGLKTRWADFSDPNSPWKNHASEMYAIDSSCEPPELVLNSSLAEQVRVILDGQGTHGLKARTRDLAFAGIASTVTASLLSEAIFSIAIENPPTLENLSPWQKNLVELAAPLLHSDKEPGDAVEELLKDLENTETVTDIIRQEVPLVAQRLSKTASSIEKGVIEVVNHGE